MSIGFINTKGIGSRAFRIDDRRDIGPVWCSRIRPVVIIKGNSLLVMLAGVQSVAGVSRALPFGVLNFFLNRNGVPGSHSIRQGY